MWHMDHDHFWEIHLLWWVFWMGWLVFWTWIVFRMIATERKSPGKKTSPKPPFTVPRNSVSKGAARKIGSVTTRTAQEEETLHPNEHGLK